MYRFVLLAPLLLSSVPAWAQNAAETAQRKIEEQDAERGERVNGTGGSAARRGDLNADRYPLGTYGFRADGIGLGGPGLPVDPTPPIGVPIAPAAPSPPPVGTDVPR